MLRIIKHILPKNLLSLIPVKMCGPLTFACIALVATVSVSTVELYAIDITAYAVETSAPLKKFDLSKEIVLRYLIVTNKRLPVMTHDDILKALLHMKTESKAIIGADLTFESVGEMPVDEYFKKYLDQDLYRLDLARYYVEVSNEVEAIDKLAKNMTFSMRNMPLEEMRARISTKLSLEEAKKSTRDELIKTAATFQVESLKKLYSSLSADGTKLFDVKDYFQFTAWNLVGRNQDAYDIVITNQAIASAEIPTDLPIALRGGLNTGITISSNNRIHGVVIMSYYPMVGTDSFVRNARSSGYKNPSEIFGTYMVHELGHLLKRYGHPVDNDPGCYMTPIDSLDYPGWIANIRKTNGACKVEPPAISTYD